MKTWLKYFVEAAVIIFSILAAFWLEDWGEERKEKKMSLVYLNGLSVDLKSQSEELNGPIYFENKYDSIILLLKGLAFA